MSRESGGQRTWLEEYVNDRVPEHSGRRGDLGFAVGGDGCSRRWVHQGLVTREDGSSQCSVDNPDQCLRGANLLEESAGQARQANRQTAMWQMSLQMRQSSGSGAAEGQPPAEDRLATVAEKPAGWNLRAVATDDAEFELFGMLGEDTCAPGCVLEPTTPDKDPRVL